MTKRKKYDDEPKVEKEFLKYKYLNKSQENLAKLIENYPLTICIGFPGTAKTFISCGEAIKHLLNKKVSKIYIVKSVTTIPGEEIGFLKGSLEEKLDPFIFSFKHNIIKIIGEAKTKLLFETNQIEVLPIAYIRGISLDDCVVICDECQNLTLHAFKTLLTRIGDNCKMICLGDTEQVDLKNKNNSALRRVYDSLLDDKIGRMEMKFEDIVRNPLIQKIEEIFSKIS